MWPGWRRRTRTLIHGVVPSSVRAARQDRARIRHELEIGADEVVCVTVANYRAQKDYPTLLQAAALVTREQEGIRFVAVGQGPLESEITAEHRRLALGDRVILTGYREDAVSVMAAGDLFVLSSVHEGLPVALMEAMTLGLPVVSTAVGGIPAVVADGVSGRLVPPGDAEALAQAITAVAAGDRAAMGQAAMRAAEPFDIGAARERLEQVYRRTSRTTGAGRRQAVSPEVGRIPCRRSVWLRFG